MTSIDDGNSAWGAACTCCDAVVLVKDMADRETVLRGLRIGVRIHCVFCDELLLLLAPILDLQAVGARDRIEVIPGLEGISQSLSRTDLLALWRGEDGPALIPAANRLHLSLCEAP